MYVCHTTEREYHFLPLLTEKSSLLSKRRGNGKRIQLASATYMIYNDPIILCFTLYGIHVSCVVMFTIDLILFTIHTL
jgi:hypothetical protein